MSAISEEADPLSASYGDVRILEFYETINRGMEWTNVAELDSELVGDVVRVRGWARTTGNLGEDMVYLQLREDKYTVRCVLKVKPRVVSQQMVKYAAGLSDKEYFVDVEGMVFVRLSKIEGTSQQVEIHVSKLYCVGRDVPVIPFSCRDDPRIDDHMDPTKKHDADDVCTCLKYKFFGLGIKEWYANLGISRIQDHIEMICGKFLLSKEFEEIHTPKLLSGYREGDSAAFKLDYNGQLACLSQSPQLHKQMAIVGGFERVFEFGPIFTEEISSNHRRLCEFVGLDVETIIKENYSEVMDLVDFLFVAIFDSINENMRKELNVMSERYPFRPLKYLPRTLQLTFEEGIQMLQDAGVNVDSLENLSTEAESKLGQLVFEKFDTEFYILHRYPLAVRPFDTMPCSSAPLYSNSFDAFMRGKRVVSGAQHIHIASFLAQRAEACGIDVRNISAYLDSFRLGACGPLGGFRARLDHVVGLFFALDSIRMTTSLEHHLF